MSNLPILIASVLTKSPRYRPSFTWSSLWVVNVFRCFEYVFGRRTDIRVEQVCTDDGIVISYTWENYFATLEGMIRTLFARKLLTFSVVYLTPVQITNNTHKNQSPFRFAIAYDIGLTNQGSGASPVSWNHTVTGSNPNLLGWSQTSGTDSNTMTYNAVSMTSVQHPSNSLNCTLAYLGTPSTGVNSLAVSFTTGGWSRGASISYSGCDTAIDNSNSAQVVAATTPLGVSITSVANNCWMVMCATLNNSAIAAGASTTDRLTDATFHIGWYDSNGVITPAGARTLQVTWSGSQNIVLCAATLAPTASVVVVDSSRLLSLLGVGS